MYKQLLFLVCSLCIVINVHAQAELESHKFLIQHIHTYIENNITKIENTEVKIKIGKIDNRLKLTKCTQPIKITASPALSSISSRVSINVQCETPTPWSLYIPVKLQRLAEVYVAAEPVSKGTIIDIDQLQNVSVDILKLRSGYFDKAEDVVGMVAKKNIRVGTILASSHIRPPLIIKKGDKVDILAKTGEIEIRMSGKALNAGAKGEQIGVTNLSSKRKLHATVIKPGLVKVSL